ncbi:MAG TPA: hypothetical protein VH480_02325 [Streptosporangiaceae bacterium]
MHSQPDRPRRVGGRRKAAAGPAPGSPVPGLDRPPELLRQYLEMVQLRARRAASWLESSSHYAHLVNRDGVIPLTVRFGVEDLLFLAKARENLLEFTELGLRLADLHQPLDDGPAAGAAPGHGPADLDQRCRSCMWRWPCPTFRILDEVLARDPEPA